MHVRSSGFDPDRPEADHPHQGRTHHPCMGQRSRVIGRSIATHLSHKTKAFRDTPNGPRAASREKKSRIPSTQSVSETCLTAKCLCSASASSY